MQVLKLCRAAGLVRLGHVALDGTKMQANASVHKAMSYGRMREAEGSFPPRSRHGSAHAEATDAAEDREHGTEKRGDEMPDWVANKAARLDRIRAAKAALEAEAKEPPPQDDDRPGPSSGMMKSGKTERGADGGPPDRAQRNFTDPDSRIQPTRGGGRSTRLKAIMLSLPLTAPIRSSSPSACRPARPMAAHSGRCSLLRAMCCAPIRRGLCRRWLLR